MPDRILVVDDEREMVEATRMVLEGEGYVVIVASSGEEALQKADSEMPDLIFLDVVMPGKSGLEVCKLLKSQPKTKHITILMFTVLGRQVDRTLSVEAGADGHFTKPFAPEALLAEVRKRLNETHAEKFSRQLGIEHSKLTGKKLLLEVDPSTRYERFVRDFALESAAHGETVIVVTKRGSAIRQVLEGVKDVEIADFNPTFMLSSILEKYQARPVSLVYDSLTDLALSTTPQAAYNFASNAIELMVSSMTTAVFLLSPTAHDSRDVSSLKGLFSNQATYTEQGATHVKIT